MSLQVKINNLPIWAQNHIKNLEQQKQELQDALKELQGGDDMKGWAELDYGYLAAENRKVDPLSINFNHTDINYYQLRLTAERRHATGELTGEFLIRGSTSIVVLPEALNSVRIKVRDDA